MSDPRIEKIEHYMDRHHSFWMAANYMYWIGVAGLLTIVVGLFARIAVMLQVGLVVLATAIVVYITLMIIAYRYSREADHLQSKIPNKDLEEAGWTYGLE